MDKVRTRKIVEFCFMSLFAGVVIGVGATCFLYATFVTSDVMLGRVIGGILFSLGIYSIIAFGMKLFTGLIANIPDLQKNEVWKLPVCFLFNTIGVALAAVLVRLTIFGGTVFALGSGLIEGKLDDPLWALKAPASGALCGVLITMAIHAPKYAPQHGLSETLGAMLPVVVFAFCGFDHSVANMFYLFALGEVSWRVVGYILLTILGNIIGGTAFPLIVKFKNKTEKIEGEQEKTE